MGVKVKDLAEMLQLSPATVSLVLNNKPGISEATRNRVIQAVKELGCEDILLPETREKKNLLFLVYRKHGAENASTPYFSQLFSEIIEGVESQSRAKGYNLMISYADKNTMAEEASKINKQDVAGVLVLATEMAEEQIDIFDGQKVPIVMIDNYMEHRAFDCVMINNEQGVFQVVEHLKEMGHKKIGYLHVGSNANNFNERYYGFRRAMDRCGFRLLKENIFLIDTDGGEAVYRELKRELEERKGNLPTAFFADNDIVAICAMRVFRELGYRMPEDISIVGFDNMTLSEMLDPPLTTIQIPKRKIGISAVNLIAEKISEDTGGQVKMEVGTCLIQRKSVKCLKDVEE